MTTTLLPLRAHARSWHLLILLVAFFLPANSFSQTDPSPAATVAVDAPQLTTPTIDSGDTAWILASTALVLFMTIPGLALFYGGLVRSKNILSVFMHCLVLTGLVSIIWVVFGYSLALDDSVNPESGVIGLGSFLGGTSKFMFANTLGNVTGTIPELLMAAFQMTFAVITPALIVGAFAERMKFSAVVLFSAIWLVVVYIPICHMTWGGGLFAQWGVIDLAGGIVVHVTAGFAALVACLMVGPVSYTHLTLPTTPYV